MTDNEIIRALECCASWNMTCRACPYVGIFAARQCERNLSRDAFDLIKRQQAEIERLQIRLQDSTGGEIDQFNK